MIEQNRLCLIFLISSFLFALLSLTPIRGTERFTELCLTISSTLASGSLVKQQYDNRNN